MTQATPRIDRLARWITAAATLWFSFAAAWGMFGIPGGGHIGAGSAGNVMAAEQSLRWKTIYPVWNWFDAGRPDVRGAALCHHPFGQYWIPEILLRIFGHHDFVVHLPAVLMSIALPPLLYGVAKERWGAPAGAVAAAAYAVTPIAVGFSSFWNLETICIFGALLFFWGHSRHLTTHKGRYLAAGLAGLVVTCSGDWVGYLIVTPTLAWGFARAFVLPAKATAYVPFDRYARWWAASVAIAASTLALWVGLFQHVGHLGEWLSSADSRGGDGTTLRAALDARAAWIDFSFTPLAITIGKLAAPVCVARLVVLRRDEETYALGLLFGATVQYVGFKEGADVHIFWPHYFAPYFALALAQLAATIAAGARWLARRAPSRAGTIGAAAGLIAGLSPALAMAHDGVQSLWVWRRTGGRYDENGGFIRSNVDYLFTLRSVVRPRSPPGSTVDTNHSADFGWEHLWAFQGGSNSVDMPAAASRSVASHPFWIGRSTGMTADDLRRAASLAHVRVYGETWVVDQREPRAPIDAYSLDEREPDWFEWLVYDGTEPVRSIGAAPDPWLTWEWRTLVGQHADPPRGAPTTLEETRIAHNLAVVRGDGDLAARYEQRIVQQLDRSVQAGFTAGVRLLGIRRIGGVEPRVESWFEVSAPIGEAAFDVRSRVVARGRFSLIPPDPTDRDMGGPPVIPTKLWLSGCIYETVTVLNHRIGREVYWGAWQALGAPPVPKRADGKPGTTLVTLP